MQNLNLQFQVEKHSCELFRLVGFRTLSGGGDGHARRDMVGSRLEADEEPARDRAVQFSDLGPFAR